MTVDGTPQSGAHNNMTKKGFTLIELMIVMVIMGILAAIGVTAFMASQIKGRDAQRKESLKGIASALELYYNDKGSYPAADSSGYILACYSGGVTVRCDRSDTDHSIMTDGTTIYMATIPGDPTPTQNYFYVSNGKQFQLYAHLQNNQDSQIITPAASGTSCGTNADCNYGVASANINP